MNNNRKNNDKATPSENTIMSKMRNAKRAPNIKAVAKSVAGHTANALASYFDPDASPSNFRRPSPVQRKNLFGETFVPVPSFKTEADDSSTANPLVAAAPKVKVEDLTEEASDEDIVSVTVQTKSGDKNDVEVVDVVYKSHSHTNTKRKSVSSTVREQESKALAVARSADKDMYEHHRIRTTPTQDTPSPKKSVLPSMTQNLNDMTAAEKNTRYNRLNAEVDYLLHVQGVLGYERSADDEVSAFTDGRPKYVKHYEKVANDVIKACVDQKPAPGDNVCLYPHMPSVEHMEGFMDMEDCVGDNQLPKADMFHLFLAMKTVMAVLMYEALTGMNLMAYAKQKYAVHSWDFLQLHLWYYNGICMPNTGDKSWSDSHNIIFHQRDILEYILPHPVIEERNARAFVQIFHQGPFHLYKKLFKYHFSSAGNGGRVWYGYYDHEPSDYEDNDK